MTADFSRTEQMEHMTLDNKLSVSRSLDLELFAAFWTWASCFWTWSFWAKRRLYSSWDLVSLVEIECASFAFWSNLIWKRWSWDTKRIILFLVAVEYVEDLIDAASWRARSGVMGELAEVEVVVVVSVVVVPADTDAAADGEIVWSAVRSALWRFALRMGYLM